MELRQLEYFQAASRLQSFTRAAEELHVAQPTITNAIQKLNKGTIKFAVPPMPGLNNAELREELVLGKLVLEAATKGYLYR